MRLDGPRTLLAVHAHPDDESTATGGILAHYASRGVRTVVITCTNGEQGDAPGGLKPGDPGHHPRAVAAHRLTELKQACETLKVSDLETLGYQDSGMTGEVPVGAFCAVPVETAAGRVAALIEHYRPQVVVTYDHRNPHQHRDHVHAGRVAQVAVEATNIAAKLYLKAHGTAYWDQLLKTALRAGIRRGPIDPVMRRTLDEVDRRITTTIDISAEVDTKRKALHCHASQLPSSIAGRLSPRLFAEAFATESYIRALDSTNAPLPETDLFAGITNYGPDLPR